MTSWLLKTEPGSFSFDDLVRNGTEPWDGVTNATALRHLRNAQVGERCVIYHTGDERRAVGLGTVASAAYPDPRQSEAKLVVIDIKAGPRLAHPVSLQVIKADDRFADSPLVRIGRLSVVPLSDQQYDAILELSSRGD